MEFNCKLLYDYTTNNNIGALMHIFKLYDENNDLIYEYKNLKCNKYIPKDHCFSKEYINNFVNNISIKTKDSIKKKFVDLIFDFHIIDKNVFYKDLYFKDYLKR